ncbi:MAG TPA: S9 family peptidase [Hyphomonadaceae bacterium]|nr:S9 family peptidase [Hyphomonadaceae bacterium]
MPANTGLIAFRSCVAAIAVMVLAGTAAAQVTQEQARAAAAEAAKKANRDIEKAQAEQKPVDAPAWNGVGPPPADLFLARPALAFVQMSPDGKHVAAMRRDKGVTYLMLVNLEGGGTKALQLDGMNITGIDWGSNDRILYTAGAENVSFRGDEYGIVMVGAPRMYSVGLDLKNPILFFEKDKRLSRENFASRITGRIPGDDRHVLMPMRIVFKLNLLKVDIYTGEWEVVGNGEQETQQWFVDRTGKPVIRLDRANPRGTEIAVMVRKETFNGGTTWRKAQTLRVDRTTSNTPDFVPLSGGPVSAQYYVKARREEGGTIGVYLYDLEKDAFVETLFSKENADADQVIFDPDTGAYAGTFYWEDRLKFEFADPALRETMNVLDASFQKAWNVIPVDRAMNNKRWLTHASNPTSPGGYYIYDADRKAAVEFGLLQPALAPVKPGQVFAVGFTARDSMQINGYLTAPPGWNERSPRPPLIVMPHGGPEARDTYVYSPLVQFLASRGYAIFQPNFRGSAGYGKAFQDAGRGRWGDAVQDDIADGVKFLIDKGMADADRICIFGASYGGYAAMMSAARHPDLYQCAVSASGPTDLEKMLRWERNEGGANSSSYRYWVSQIGDPAKDEARIEAASPALHAAKITVPVLLIHGKRDNTVPFEQSEFMRDAMKKAGKPVELSVYENAGHGFGGRDAIRYYTELVTFFGKHLGQPQ